MRKIGLPELALRRLPSASLRETLSIEPRSRFGQPFRLVALSAACSNVSGRVAPWAGSQHAIASKVARLLKIGARAQKLTARPWTGDRVAPICLRMHCASIRPQKAGTCPGPSGLRSTFRHKPGPRHQPHGPHRRSEQHSALDWPRRLQPRRVRGCDPEPARRACKRVRQRKVRAMGISQVPMVCVPGKAEKCGSTSTNGCLLSGVR